jgi:hypothetical protein
MVLRLNNRLIQKAVNALKETAYDKNKKVIKKMFELPSSRCPVLLRLRVIDSFYSTNFRMRQFGFEDLAEAIEKIGSDNDIRRRLEKIITECTLSADRDILELFKCNNWGAIRKNGRKTGHGQSLISKYFYFLSGYRFPIYDSLVREGLYDWEESYPENFSDLLPKLSELRKIYKTTYDHLDQFFWLWGKIKYKSYSLVVNDKRVYLEIEGKNKEQVLKILKRNKWYSKLNIFIRAISDIKD